MRELDIRTIKRKIRKIFNRKARWCNVFFIFFFYFLVFVFSIQIKKISKLKYKKAHQIFYLKEKELKQTINDLKLNERSLLNNLNENAKEIEQLKREKLDSIRNYKNEAVHQIESLMETLLAKDDIIQVCARSFFSTRCSLIYFFFCFEAIGI